MRTFFYLSTWLLEKSNKNLLLHLWKYFVFKILSAIFFKDPDAIILRVKTTAQSRLRLQKHIQKAPYDMYIFKKDFIFSEKFQYKQQKKVSERTQNDATISNLSKSLQLTANILYL